MSEKSKEATTARPSRPLKSESPAADSNDRWLVFGVCIFLVAITFAVFGQTLRDGFVYDDDDYVCNNPEVTRGLTLNGIVWAFTHVHASNWHPLTWISHMLDCQLYGLNPGGHHLSNILLHATTVILLFLVLRRMSGALWRSAFVAAVFAIHPLRVESVAWVAERKDVLSGVFFMLTIGAYVRFVQRPSRRSRARPAGAATGGRKSDVPAAPTFDSGFWNPDYFLVVLFFALGLMCKPMLVTLPVVLLLLDYWPLNRVARVADTTITGHRSNLFPIPSRLVLEKLPLFGLAAASGVATLFAQTDAIQSFDQIPLHLRVGNALISIVAYMGQMFWPSGLAVLYPLAAKDVAVSRVVESLVLLAGISAGTFVLRRRRYLLTGWLWYLIMLLPVIGIVQVGVQSRADRYTYLPQIGLYLLLTWAAAELCSGWRYRRLVLGGGATIILAALIFSARTQTSYWRNSESLWTHTLACTSGNYVAEGNLGYALFQKGEVDKAMGYFQTALQIKPDFAQACYDLGYALFQKGEVDKAMGYFQTALQIKPDYAQASYNLGLALLQKGSADEALAFFQKALQIKPDYAEAESNWGGILFQKGRVDEAIVHCQKALKINPDSVLIRNNLDHALLLKNKVGQEISLCQNALQTNPDSPDVLNNLAWLLATCPDADVRDGAQAVKYAGHACELTHYGVTVLVGTLAAAYAEAGRFDDAVATAQKACALATAAGERDLLENNRKLLVLYRAHQPYHEAVEDFAPTTP